MWQWTHSKGSVAEAGRLLAAELFTRKLQGDVIVIALPRGGLPVGLEVAKTFGAPLDVVIVRKLGVPWQPELAMGAIASGSFQTRVPAGAGVADASGRASY
jgi:predicted phosphoribosyltransferase